MKSVWVALAAAALGLGAASAWLTGPTVPPALATLWQQHYPDPDGQPQSLAQWQGQPLVINFWASWCTPCREEMPDFDALRKKYRAAGVEFVGIAIDSPENVKTFLKKFPVSYPILIGEGAAHVFSRELGNPSGGLPHTLVLDRSGEITASHPGRLSRPELDAMLARVAN